MELTTEELAMLIECLDLATKHGGLNAAARALPLATKLVQELESRKAQTNGRIPEVQDVTD